MVDRGRVAGFLFQHAPPCFSLRPISGVHSRLYLSSLFHSFAPTPFAIKFKADTSHSTGAQTTTRVPIWWLMAMILYLPHTTSDDIWHNGHFILRGTMLM